MRRVALVLALLAVCGTGVQAQPADWSVRRDPFDRSLIARYKALLARDPHDRLALSALASLYKRHRTMALLVREYEDTLEQAETAPALVVLGRLARNANDSARAVDLYARAVALNPADSRSWLAVGELRAAQGDKDAARTAFATASKTARTTAHKQAALRALVSATRQAGDRTRLAEAFDALLALTPKDGRLWSDRGDAELELKDFDAAVASYKRAEELLARDPERRLLAITARALAFDRMGKPGEAITEYERAQAAAPPGYYLRREATIRIIDVFRRHHSLDAALGYLTRTWSSEKRGAFEWATLAELYKEMHDTDSMVRALHQAVKHDPRDTNLQWKLIRHYDAAQEADLALSLLEVAAAASPRDVSLNLELAQRLWSTGVPMPRRTLDDFRDLSPRVPELAVQRMALSIARKLSASIGRNVEAHRALAEVYARWDRLDLALDEARKVAALEPSDDNLALLGDALFAANRHTDAMVTWKKIAKAGTPAALQRVAEIYLDHQLWSEAVDAFTEAMFGDLNNAQLWRGRASAFAELGRLNEARIDAQHAVGLMGLAPYEKGHEIRFRLVQIMRDDAISEALGDDTVEPDLWLMQLDTDFKGKKRDVQSGYLLAEYFRRRPDERLMHVLVELHARVPNDHGIASELIRVYRGLEKFDEAIALIQWLALADSTRGGELAEVTAAIERDRPIVAAREAREARVMTEGPEDLLAVHASRVASRPAEPLSTRVGLRLGVGDALRGPASGSLTLGGRMMWPIRDEVVLMSRVDWVRRARTPGVVDDMASVDALAASVGLAFPLVRNDSGVVLIGGAYRTELRLADAMDRPGYDRVGFAADATIELIPRRLPVSLGMRVEQSLSERGESSTFLMEATVELR